MHIKDIAKINKQRVYKMQIGDSQVHLTLYLTEAMFNIRSEFLNEGFN